MANTAYTLVTRSGKNGHAHKVAKTAYILGHKERKARPVF